MKLETLALLGAAAAVDPFYNPSKPYPQEMTDNFNPLKYTAWLGPYSQRRGVGLNRDVPQGCRVDQVSVLHRHGARYPDKGAVKSFEAALSILNEKKGKFNGTLAFYNEWEPYASVDTGLIAQESTVGAYGGLADAYVRGAEYRRRYNNLFKGELQPFFSSGYERIVMTARSFGQGFLGFNYSDLAVIEILPETKEQGLNTLVPICDSINATTCAVPSEKDVTDWPSNPPWVYEEFERGARRLNREHGLSLNSTTFPQLLAVAAYELNVRGGSPFVPLFTSEEWIAFEYWQSSYYYCYAGPGCPTIKEQGSLWLNATRELFLEGPEAALPLAFSFTHDTSITPVVSLLGLATPDSYDPTKVHFGSLWDQSDITPQGAHLTLERLVCDESWDSYETLLEAEYPVAYNLTYGNNITSNYTVTATNGTVGTNLFVRVILNEAVAPIPACNSGPGKSCRLQDFDELVTNLTAGLDYVKTCNISSDAPQSLSFFWDWKQNINNETLYNPDVVPYQAGYVGTDGQPIEVSNNWRRR